MNKAKIILTSIATFAIISGTIAFKARRFNPPGIWYIPGNVPAAITHTVVGGFVYSTTIPNCTLTAIATTTIGPLVLTSTSSTRADKTTVFIREISPGVSTSFTTTYHFCTPFWTRTTMINT